jgi:ATP-dependent Clp protease ATP-binding subunit ClpA
MAKNRRIDYYDLRAEREKLPMMVGRREEGERLARVIGRRLNNNVLVVGPSGIGKTTFVQGWVRNVSRQEAFSEYQFIQLDTEHLDSFVEALEDSRVAMESLPPCVLILDDFGRALHNRSSLAGDVFKLYGKILSEPTVRIIATLDTHEHEWLSREFPALIRLFETIALKQQSEAEFVRILQTSLGKLGPSKPIMVPTSALREVVAYVERFPKLGQMPLAGMSLLDECLSYASFRRDKSLKPEAIAHVVASKLGIPKTQLTTDELDTLAALKGSLNERIIGQEHAVNKIVTTLQRAKLGLRNPNRPLGSFLVLGPSGVGKTETAKLVAEYLFGRTEAFTRVDMSEFQQEHTVQRLIGAPAGYLGYEEGGALTNALRREPHSLILLDEIEKAHPKVFDIFLQVLDDGRLTSGQNETVDARNSVIMATSNIGVDRILQAINDGGDTSSEEFIQEHVIPALSETFRMEFINRFDSILVFNPLSIPALIRIAELEVKKTEARLARHKVKFAIDREVIEKRIKTLCDPRLGARPVKRFIEDTCESLLAESLLAKRT